MGDPAERRKEHLALAAYDDSAEAEIFYQRLLDHFDTHEPAVAGAIRYGLLEGEGQFISLAGDQAVSETAVLDGFVDSSRYRPGPVSGYVIARG